MGEKMQLLKQETILQGAKGGGGSSHTPVEQPDDLLSVAKLKMLIAVSEGEIQGDLTAQNIFSTIRRWQTTAGNTTSAA